MPLFYFHFLNGTARHGDEIGLELRDAETAYLEAVAAAQGMGSELIGDGINPSNCSFEITDEAGRVVFLVAFTELFDRLSPPPACSALTALASNALTETHCRVLATKAEIALSLNEARNSLDESRALLARLASFGL
jgi:hypothetical protein